MATIFQQPPQQQAQQTVPIFQPQPPNDPLFEALVKYITSGPGPSSVNASDIQSIIDAHTSHPDGRSYLESLVGPSEVVDLRIWKHSIDVAGFFSTNLDSWTLFFNGSIRYPAGQVGIPYAINGEARGKGFFGMQVKQFSEAKFYWDEDTISGNISASITKKAGSVVVEFRPEVYIPESKPFAELIFSGDELRLPPYTSGLGRLSLAV